MSKARSILHSGLMSVTLGPYMEILSLSVHFCKDKHSSLFDLGVSVAEKKVLKHFSTSPMLQQSKLECLIIGLMVVSRGL